eukprot:9565036-Alexandrium_andersonii.AAC.1
MRPVRVVIKSKGDMLSEEINLRSPCSAQPQHKMSWPAWQAKEPQSSNPTVSLSVCHAAGDQASDAP